MSARLVAMLVAFGGHGTALAETVAIRSESTVCAITNPVECSGVVIAPNVVLTAAHCVATARDPIEVVRGANAAGSRDVIPVAEVRIHPRYETGAWAADLALLRLRWPTSAVPLAIGEGPAVDEVLAWEGYGIVPPSEETGSRHGGEVRVTAVGDGLVTVERGTALPCGGDSGGPLLRDGRLVALTRSGDVGCSGHAMGVVLAPALAELITPYLTTSDGASEPSLDLEDPRTCGAVCETDAECPTSFGCLAFEGESRCIHLGVPPGHLGAACEDDAGCGAGRYCLALVTAAGRTCGCLEPCDDASGGGGGCNTHRGNDGVLALVLWVSVVTAWPRQRERTRARV